MGLHTSSISTVNLSLQQIVLFGFLSPPNRLFFTDSHIPWNHIQSPYTVDFSETEVKAQIERELFPKDDVWLIGKIGITGRYGGTYEENQIYLICVFLKFSLCETSPFDRIGQHSLLSNNC